jgi:hypothetical protein
VEGADHLGRLLRELAERATAHLDPVAALLGLESLPVQDAGEACMGIRPTETLPPAEAGLVRSCLRGFVAGDDIGEHSGQEPVLVATAGHSLAGQAVDDARPPASMPASRRVLHEACSGEAAEMPADGVRVEVE